MERTNEPPLLEDETWKACHCRENRFRRNRKQSLAVISLYLLIGGMEYAVIFPTAWNYIQSLGGKDEYLLGLTVSSYSLSAMIAGLVGGRLADSYPNNTKSVTLICMFAMVIGNFQYVIGVNVWNLIVARLVCGLGTAAGSAMLAEICRVTDKHERTALLSIVNAGRQIGILVGPAFQVMLEYFNFEIGHIKITPLNAPGLFMGVLWLIFIIVAAFIMHNLTEEYYAIMAEKHAIQEYRNSFVKALGAAENTHSKTASIKMVKRRVSVTEYGSIGKPDGLAHVHGVRISRITPTSSGDNTPAYQSDTERQNMIVTCRSCLGVGSLPSSPTITSADQQTVDPERPESPCSSKSGSLNSDITDQSGKIKHEIPSFRQYVNEFLQDTVVILLAIPFVVFFSELGVETVIPIITQKAFDFNQIDNSFIYMGGGIVALVIYAILALMSDKLPDFAMILVGCLFMLAGFVWMLIVVPLFTPGDRYFVPHFVTGLSLLYVGFPIAGVSSNGLLSTALSNDTQGLGQGIRRAVTYLGLILGPVWAGASINNPHMSFAVPTALFIFVLLLYMCSFRKFVTLECEYRSRSGSSSQASTATIDADSERQPLIAASQQQS